MEILQMIFNYFLAQTKSNANKKKLCCCLAMIAENAVTSKIKDSAMVVAAAKGVVDVMLIQNQSQQVWDACFNLLENTSHILEFGNPTSDAKEMSLKLNHFANNIPIG